MRLIHLFGLSTLVSLGACGGGSDLNGKLSVSASYPPTVGTVTQKSNVGINLSGLEGNKATCNFGPALNTRYENIYSNNSPIPTGVTAVSTLPSGFSIDRNTCMVTVDINQPGT
jgi:hypothetical protein